METKKKMNILKHINVMLVAGVVVLGANAIAPSMTVKADSIQEQTQTTNVVHTELMPMDLDQYVFVENGQYVLRFPNTLEVNSEYVAKLQDFINQLNATIEMSNLEIAVPEQLEVAAAWKYWGNGVYTKGNKVKVNWAQTWGAIGNISRDTWIGSMAGGWGKPVRPPYGPRR